MRILANTIKTSASIVVALTLLSGCAINMPVPVKDPVVSGVSYKKAATPTPVILAFKDEQTTEDKAKLLTGRIPMQMMYKDKPFDAVPWIAQQTAKEMAARGLPVSLVEGSAAGTTVAIKRVHIENHRVSGFSPFVTLTSLRADVMTARGPQRVTAFIKRGKVPVWSFDEVIEPTYNDPLSILVKELAAKLNQQLMVQAIGNDEVEALIVKINKDGGVRADAFMDVYQLGFGNNSTAVPALVKLAKHDNEYVRQAALSSLGILKANDQFSFLSGIYETKATMWQDRAMALKAIGDLGTPQSQAYLQKEWDGYKDITTTDALWFKEIIGLYL